MYASKHEERKERWLAISGTAITAVTLLAPTQAVQSSQILVPSVRCYNSAALTIATSTFTSLVQAVSTAATETGQAVSTLYKLVATDYVELVVFQNSCGNLNIQSAGNYSPELSMTRVG